MSLTSQLDRKDSPLRQFFEARLPNVKTMQRDYRAAGLATIVPSADNHPGAVGAAIDYRIRYFFAATPTQELVASSGADAVETYLLKNEPVAEPFGRMSVHAGPSQARGRSKSTYPPFVALAERLDALISEYEPQRRHSLLPDDAEELLCRSCLVLADFEACRRRVRVLRPDHPLVQAGRQATLEQLLALPAPADVADVQRLAGAFVEGQGDLLDRQAILNPTFGGSGFVGGADADLIVDNCLFEIKTTVATSLRKLQACQLLGYALLDFPDEFQITRLGLCLTRQTARLEWPLQAILDEAAGEPVRLSQLRTELQGALATEGLQIRFGRQRPQTGHLPRARHPSNYRA